MEPVLSRLLNDLRYAVRQLARTPAFTITALVTLALGIGVNAAMFSVIDQVLLAPLPYRNSDRIVELGAQPSLMPGFEPVSLPDLMDWRARSHVFQQIGYYTLQFAPMGGKDNAKLVPELMVSTNFLEVFGVQPMLGRSFVADDLQGGRTSVILLGNAVWKSIYHGDPQIVGQSVKINGDPHQVIGVMPESFHFPAGVDEETFAPLPVDDAAMQHRDNAGTQPIGLLRAGVSVEQARAELNSIHTQLVHEHPKEESSQPIKVERYRDSVTDQYRPALYALSVAVVAVWLVACINVAGLMLTRATGRRREIAIRGALGAPRARLLQQFLVESLVLALGGGALGLVLAAGALRVLKYYLSHQILYGDRVHIDLPVLFFLLLISVVSALLFGLVPGWQATGVPVQQGMREGSAASGTGKSQTRMHDAFVVGEVALTLVLLIAAGLTLRMLLTLRHANLGFSATQVETGTIYLPQHGIWFSQQQKPDSPSIVLTLYQPLLAKLRQIPGVDSVGLTTVRPLMPNWNFVDSIIVNGRPEPPKGEEPHASLRAVDAGYFSTFGVRLMRGRSFGAEDTPDSPVSAIVNQAFVQRVFPKEEPLGKQVQIADNGPREWATIVGVAEDVRQHSAGEVSQPEFDLNLMQLKPADDLYGIAGTYLMNVGVRTRLPGAVTENGMRRALHDLQPDSAMENLEPMQQVVDDSLGSQTLAARLLGIFGLAALLIAAAGIYGLLAYSVSQRTREIGLRIALGAQRRDVLWLVMSHALVLLGTGAVVGIVTALLAGGVLRSFLDGLHAWDVLTVASVIVLLSVSGVVASYFPARRASRIDPMEALRSD